VKGRLKVSERGLEIKMAFKQLMTACGFSGVAGTEALFDLLSVAIQDVEVKWGSNREDDDAIGLLTGEMVDILEKEAKLASKP
jgi:hypothetical protein